MEKGKKEPESVASEVPDGGYGWVIVFGAALTHFLLVGIGRCLGIIHVALLEEFGESETETAWVAAIFNTCRTLTAPLCALLSDWLGNRTVALIGSILMFVGLSMSAFATKLFHLYITFGITAGIGGAMVFTTAYIMIGQYFAKNKGKAMGFALLGCGLGNIAFAHITNLTMHTYGYWGSMLILGAIQLNHAISGALYRPLEIKVQKNVTTDDVLTSSTQQIASNGTVHKEMLKHSTEKVFVNKHLDHIDLQYTSHNKSLSAIPDHIKLHDSYTALPMRHRLNTDSGHHKHSMQRLDNSNSKRKLGSSFNSLIFAVSNTTVNASSQRSVNSSTSPRVDLKFPPGKRTSLDSNALINALEDGNSEGSDTVSQTSQICRLFNWQIAPDSLLFNVQFYFYAVVIMAMQVGIQGFLIFLPGFAQEYNLTANETAMLISIYGTSDMVGSLGFGFIIDLQCVQNKRLVLHSCAGILFGVFTIFMAGMKNFVSFAIITALVGTFEGATHSQRMSVLSDFISPEKLPVAVGMVLLFQGVGNIYGPPLGGFLRDKSDTNAYCFMLCGIYMASAAFVFLVYSVVAQLCRQKARKQSL